MNNIKNQIISFCFKAAFFSILLHSSLTLSIHKTHVNSEKIADMCEQLYRIIKNDNFSPDLIIGISRGGLVPLGYLAGERMFDIRQTLSISVKSYDFMSQGDHSLLLPIHTKDIEHCKSILIVDDIVDSGKTIAFVCSFLKNTLKDTTIKVAALLYKPKSSSIKPDYYVEETDDWIVFPWESNERGEPI